MMNFSNLSILKSSNALAEVYSTAIFMLNSNQFSSGMAAKNINLYEELVNKSKTFCLYHQL